MKEPLKIGDRVAVYAADSNLFGDRGKIATITGNRDLYSVQLDKPTPCADTPLVHRAQIRRLKKREQRRVWINPIYLFSKQAVALRDSEMRIVTSAVHEPGFIEFIEVRKKQFAARSPNRERVHECGGQR